MSRRGDCYDNAVMESFFSTVTSELADRFASLSEAKMELFDYIEVFATNGAGIRRSARSVRRPSNDAQRPRNVHRGALGGQLLPSNDNDGHATKRPSTFFEHRRRLNQPTRKPTDLTNPSNESDQVHGRPRPADGV